MPQFVMRRLFPLLGLALLVCLPAWSSSRPSAAGRLRLQESCGRLPLAFEANQGQTDRRVRFVSHGSGCSVFLTPTRAVFALHRRSSNRNAVLTMRLIGARPAPPQGQDRLPGRISYFIGRNPHNWHTDVPAFGKVRCPGVYPGIGLVYYGSHRQLEYDFVVAPHARPAAIRLSFAGVRRLRLDPAGDLLAALPGGTVRWRRPQLYQPAANGRHVPVGGRYRLLGAHQVGFQVGAYDRDRPLVIDPVLVYATYLGGSGFETGAAVAVDAAGDAYLTGQTESPDFPATPGALQGAFGGFTDAFVSKISADGAHLLYSTYLGGSGHDSGAAIAVDAQGGASVAGSTSGPLNSGTDFPITPRAFQPVYGGGDLDAFVAKLSPDGAHLLYSTYLGGSGDDEARGIALDAAGNAYVTGFVAAPFAGLVFPVTPGALQTTFAGGFSDAFAAKLSADGAHLLYSTLLGGSGDDYGSGIAVDASGSARIAGETNSADLPTTAGAFQTALGGGVDGFVACLSPDGARLLAGTFLGGSGDDHAFGIALDGAGSAYVTGQTDSPDFPTTPGAFQSGLAGSAEAFVAKLSADARTLQYGTLLGGSRLDFGAAIAVDGMGRASVAGRTGSANFPVTAGAPQAVFGGGLSDAFAAQLSPDGAHLLFSTFLGGHGSDAGSGIAVDGSGALLVAGTTYSADFPTTPGALQPVTGGTADAFAARLTPAAAAGEHLAALTLAPPSLTGGHEAQGTVFLTIPAPPGGALVRLTSADPSRVRVPSQVTVAPGATRGTFPLATSPVGAVRAVSVTASYGDRTRLALLTLRPPSLAVLVLSPVRVSGRSPAIGIVVLDGPAPAGGVRVDLSSAGPAVAGVPGQVTIPAGGAAAWFPITTHPVRAVTSVAITATAGGASHSATLTVVP